MTYVFPGTLHPLRDWLRTRGADASAFKSERQAAFLAQQLVGTRFKFPAKGASCFLLLQSIQRSLPVAIGNAPKSHKSGAQSSKSVACCPMPAMDIAVPPGLVIYADGACEPNPGAGGWGFVVYRDGVEIHSGCGGGPGTNQTMELTAALMALRWFAARGIVEPVRLLSDSRYTVDGCNSWMPGWKAKGWRRGGPKAKAENCTIANLDLWKALDEVLALVPITLEWVKGHAGIMGNERADELSLIGREQAIEGYRAAVDTPAGLIEQQLDYSARCA